MATRMIIDGIQLCQNAAARGYCEGARLGESSYGEGARLGESGNVRCGFNFAYTISNQRTSLEFSDCQKLPRVVVDSTNDTIEHAVSLNGLHYRISAFARH